MPMNIALWVAQAWLAVVMLIAGAVKLLIAKPELERRRGMEYAAERSATEMKLIGAAEILGAVGLILPYGLGIAPVLTPVAAIAITILMLGAVVTHLRRGESVVLPGVLAAIGLFVAVGRLALL